MGDRIGCEAPQTPYWFWLPSRNEIFIAFQSIYCDESGQKKKEMRSTFLNVCDFVNKTTWDGIQWFCGGCCGFNNDTPVTPYRYLRKRQGYLPKKYKFFDLEAQHGGVHQTQKQEETIPPHSVRQWQDLQKRRSLSTSRETAAEKETEKSTGTRRDISSQTQDHSSSQDGRLGAQVTSRAASHLRYRHESVQSRLVCSDPAGKEDSFVLL